MIFIQQTGLNSGSIEERIEEDAKAHGLMLKKHFPFSENLPQNGLEIKEHASVFEFCKAPLAARLLNTQPELNVLMPCRISVYEKEGVTYAATPNLKVQLEMLECDNELKQEIYDLYDNMTAMIKAW